MYGGRECPDEQEKVCNVYACPTPSPTATPTKAPTAVPATTPLIHINNGDIITIEAIKGGVYSDAGAMCEDEIDGKLAVTASGSVKADVPGAYTITYSCINKRGYSARAAVRQVIVRDTTCPVCHVVGGAATVEAQFPYVDKGAYFTDSVDGKLSTKVEVVSNVDTKKVGTYYINYRSKDASGNYNDGKCLGTNVCRRKVQVIDTLKPVIALKFGGKQFHVSDSSDVSKSDTPHANPAAKYFSLMAEHSVSTPGFALLMAGAVGVVALGAVLAGRRSTSTMEVPV